MLVGGQSSAGPLAGSLLFGGPMSLGADFAPCAESGSKWGGWRSLPPIPNNHPARQSLG